MELKAGDVVEFKKYEDMTEDETSCIPGKHFPKYGKVEEIRNYGYFSIEDCVFRFNPESVARVISNVNRFNPGDKVLIKATVKKAFNDSLEINSSIDDSDVVKILKRIKPECFIVQEYKYALYIGGLGDLVTGKDRAKIYESRDDANKEAADMKLNAWDVIPYDD